MEAIRVGIIGIGNMGSAHAKSIWDGNIKGMKLSAVCDVDYGRRKWAGDILGSSVMVYSNYQELIASREADAIIIATPHKLHPEIAITAFQAGLHVLTEKPAGIDAGNVRKMNRAAVNSGKVFGIMYNQRTNVLYGTLREYVRSGRLGDIKRFIWIVNNWYRTQAYYDSGTWRATWKGEGGGVLLNQCPHNLDIWQWIMGMPSGLRAYCHYGKYHHIDVEDDVTIYAEYENGATAVFVTSTGEYPGTNRMEISGTLGKAVIENGSLRMWKLERDERDICFHSEEGMPQERYVLTEVKQEFPDKGHEGILQNFADAILYGEPLIAQGEEGINGLLLSNGAYLSDWKDTWVKFPIDEDVFLKELTAKQEKTADNKPQSKPDATIPGTYNRRWDVRW